MAIKEKISIATKEAMRNREKESLIVLRSFSAAIKQKEIDEQIELDDQGVLVILDKFIKQRKDSEKQFRAAARDDLADKESFEIKLLVDFLPAQLSKEEIIDIINQSIEKVGDSNISSMGKIMAIIKPLVQGKADFKEVSELVKLRLN